METSVRDTNDEPENQTDRMLFNVMLALDVLQKAIHELAKAIEAKEDQK